mgnify:CR=1 FL=1
MSRNVINTPKAPKAIGPYSQAIGSNNFIFTSGQIPLCPKTNTIVSEDYEAQAIQCLENLKSILNDKNLDFDSIVKLTVYTTDLSQFDIINIVFLKYFKNPYPARSVVEVSKLPKNSKIEIECVCFYEK